ncbi:MAG: alternative ribosome rescue aminoacyl-tRNA hydrolase ArfB [Glaciecola sp.]
MLRITNNISIGLDEVQLSAIRAMGSGGQNVNKVSSAIHLKFDIKQSSLPEVYKERLLAMSDSRITKDGVVVIKAQIHRTQEKNKENALARLTQLIKSVTVEEKPRRATRPTLGAKRRRLDSKKRDGITKSLRKKVDY